MLTKELLDLIQLRIESSTTDFSILRLDREVYLPEISIFPLNRESVACYNQQNKIRINVIFQCGRVPVLYLVEYEEQAVMFILIHLYSTGDRFPDRWIIDQDLYKRMLGYILSLFREDKTFTCYYENFNKELSYVNSSCLYKREVEDCNTSSYSWINKPYLLLEEEKRNISRLIREFISSYGF